MLDLLLVLKSYALMFTCAQVNGLVEALDKLEVMIRDMEAE